VNAAAGGLSLAQRIPACPQCAQPMEAFDLEGHYGRQVATDLCARCNVVWFDEFESVHLSGLGWVTLLRRMNAAIDGAAAPLKDTLDCPRCRGTLKPVHNLTRFGRFASLECPRKHGHLQTFSLLLAERGLVRPLSRSDLGALAEEGRPPACLNCGAPLGAGGERCSYCDSPLVVVDMPRLMQALMRRHAEALPEAAANRVAWACRGCGAPLSPSHMVRCDRCAHPVVVPSLLDLRPVLDAVEPLLRAMQPRQARPHGEKLKKMRGDHRATAFHGLLRHASDVFDGEDGRTPRVPGWVLGVAAAGLLLWAIFG
jgi:hypothetical protein